jgi:hypothetical protein
VPVTKELKILGITFDTRLCFKNHIDITRDKASARLNILKAIGNQAWGSDKETLFLIFRALIQSVINYGNPFWFPLAEPTNVKKVQVVQNNALRVVTGCHKMASENHLGDVYAESQRSS